MLNDLQKRFLIHHLTWVMGALLLPVLMLLLFPAAVHTEPNEMQVTLRGHLAGVRFESNPTAEKTIFYLTFREFQRAFKVSGIGELDQRVMATEKMGSEFGFSVQKAEFDGGGTATILELTSSKNTYITTDISISWKKKSRSMAVFLEFAFLGTLVWLLRRLKLAYSAGEYAEYDPVIAALARNPRLGASAFAGLVFILCGLFIPSRSWEIGGTFCLAGYVYFLYWFQTHGKGIKWVQAVVEADTQSREKLAVRPEAQAPKYVKAVQMLLASGVDLSIKNESGQTPLHIAAEGGHAEAVDLLLRSGAKVDIQDSMGETALMVAAARGSLGIVMKLLAAQADVLVKNKYGESALDHAQANKKNRATLDLIAKAVASAEAAAKAKAEADSEAATKAGDKP